jgi:prune family protein 2
MVVFYSYVYHKLEKLVISDYVLVYFHGATTKHRTPDLSVLRKCYQMINLRYRIEFVCILSFSLDLY